MTNNCGPQDCYGTYGPNFHLDINGNLVKPDVSKCASYVTSLTNGCSPFDLSKGLDDPILQSYAIESLNIGGAIINVYKLLGVHEQCKLMDSVGFGKPISGGDAPGYPSIQGFSIFADEWRSLQLGENITKFAYLGYDFGEIKTVDNSRRVYGIEAGIRKNISSLAIKQSSNPNFRVTKVRVERSEDNIHWYGSAVVALPNDDCLNTILFKPSSPARYWRLRPLDFNGSSNDVWAVQALQLFHNYVPTAEDNIQDKVLFENRDRDYATDALQLKGTYDIQELPTELTRFGIDLGPKTYAFTISFAACVAILGRPIVIGDIIELPSEAQYNMEMKKVKKWLEVTEVSWASSGYTPSWTPTMLKVIAQHAYASQETQDLFGDLATNFDSMGLAQNNDGNSPTIQDFFDITQTIEAEAKNEVPERGSEAESTIRKWEEDELKVADDAGVGDNLRKIGLNPTSIYAEAAMPPNNAPFTEGNDFPANPSDRDYHRLTYTGIEPPVPPRLYRYSTYKGRWIYMETDRRMQFNPTRPILNEFLTSPDRVPVDQIMKPKSDC